jgi:hypothetical protein
MPKYEEKSDPAGNLMKSCCLNRIPCLGPAGLIIAAKKVKMFKAESINW